MKRLVLGAAIGLWLFFVFQAIYSPVLLDDWFELRYWRDHEFTLTALWQYAHHNYYFYNPRVGEVILGIVNGSRVIHWIATPLVQLAILPTVFAIAFARWPRATLRDLQLLVFIQTLIWLVIPVPGIIYFYRPFATNYLWAFEITLLLFVPYRLALAHETKPRVWLVPIMLVLGWLAGMCNEHTGPTAMLAMAICVYAASRLHRLRAWMVAGMIGLYVGYPMLFFAPGQSMRYGGLATRETPVKLIAERGISGCFAIVRQFLFESRLGILVVAAAIIRYLFTVYRRDQIAGPTRQALVTAGTLAAASLAIVVTLFASPTASERVFYASGVLLVAAFAVAARWLFEERSVRRLVMAAVAAMFGYHLVRFTDTAIAAHAETEQRLAILADATPGAVPIVPSYVPAERSHWHLGDDFAEFPWLRDYVGGELYDLEAIDLDHPEPRRARSFATSDAWRAPTYRELQTPLGRTRLAMDLASSHLDHYRVTTTIEGKPAIVVDWTPSGYRFVDGRPEDTDRGHFIRVRDLPVGARSYVVGCGITREVAPEGDLLRVDERFCRGPFRALACESDRCWLAGWY